MGNAVCSCSQMCRVGWKLPTFRRSPAREPSIIMTKLGGMPVTIVVTAHGFEFYRQIIADPRRIEKFTFELPVIQVQDPEKDLYLAYEEEDPEGVPPAKSFSQSTLSCCIRNPDENPNENPDEIPDEIPDETK